MLCGSVFLMYLEKQEDFRSDFMLYYWRNTCLLDIKKAQKYGLEPCFFEQWSEFKTSNNSSYSSNYDSKVAKSFNMWRCFF